jgi:hypothetical protein
MTRKNFFKGLLALTWPLTSFGAKKSEKVCFPVRNIWETPQGQYVLALRAELKRLDHWDDLAEDWQEVEDALKNGHMFYAPQASRILDNRKSSQMFYSIKPLAWEKKVYNSFSYLGPVNPNQSSRPRH